jgi:hypothetical protein
MQQLERVGGSLLQDDGRNNEQREDEHRSFHPMANAAVWLFDVEPI